MTAICMPDPEDDFLSEDALDELSNGKGEDDEQ